MNAAEDLPQEFGHGSGGRLSAELLRKVFLPAFSNEALDALEDQARLKFEFRNSNFGFAFTTDSFVVQPLFFPGGDIGTLAVNGTINDLAVGGATPLYLSAAFILEEGLPFADLRRIVASMRTARAGCRSDNRYRRHQGGRPRQVRWAFSSPHFSGIGLVKDGVSLSIRNARPGDKVLVSGTIGNSRHCGDVSARGNRVRYGFGE